MIEQLEKQLNCNNVLREKIEMLIEVFIDYYGEDKRKEIEEKFSRALFIAYRSPDSTKNILREIAKIHTDDIIQDLIEKYPSIWTKKDLLGEFTLTDPRILPISYFKNFYEQYQLGAEGREKKYKEETLQEIQRRIPTFTKEEYEELIKTQTIPEKYSNLSAWIKNHLLYYANLSNPIKEYERKFKEIKPLLEKIKPDITLENVSEIMENEEIQLLIQYANHLPESISEFDSRMKKYASFKEQVKKQDQIKDRLSNEYYLKLILENKDLLTEEDLEKIEEFKQDLTKSYALTANTTYLFGYSLHSNSPLEAFSKESEEILKDPEGAQWKKDSIIEDRINYFKKKGIDLGDNYENYLQSEDAKRIWPSEQRVERLIESKKRIINEFNNEYYTTLPEYQKTRSEIDSHHLLDKQDSFDAGLYTQITGPTFVNPNIVKTPNGYDLFSLVVICCNSRDGTIDHHIIHELNHLYELTLSRVDESEYEAICGWDVCKGPINNEREDADTIHIDREKREYELFNEIINELIAQEIYEKMLEKDRHVFDTKDTAKVRNTTSYENTFFLIKDFFQEYRKEILESRCNGQIEIIWNRVGKENFDALNDLFRIFNEHFQGFRYYGLVDSLKKNEDNEQTRIYYDLIAKRDQILDKMRKHSMLQEEKEVTKPITH